MKNKNIKLALIAGFAAFVGVVIGQETFSKTSNIFAAWLSGVFATVLFGVVAYDPKEFVLHFRDTFIECFGSAGAWWKTRHRRWTVFRRQFKRYELYLSYDIVSVSMAVMLMVTIISVVLLIIFLIEGSEPASSWWAMLIFMSGLVVVGPVAGFLISLPDFKKTLQKKIEHEEKKKIIEARRVAWRYLFQVSLPGVLWGVCKLIWKNFPDIVFFFKELAEVICTRILRGLGKFFLLLLRKLNTDNRRACVICALIGFVVGFSLGSSLIGLVTGCVVGFLQAQAYQKFVQPNLAN